MLDTDLDVTYSSSCCESTSDKTGCEAQVDRDLPDKQI